MKPKSAGYIYALIDDGELRYIGQAKDPKKRFAQHCSLAQNRGNTHKQRWLRELLMSDHMPELFIVEQTDDMDEAETRTIKECRELGFRLTNTADGGKSMSHTQRAKEAKPWGKSLGPLQWRLKMMNEIYRFQLRRGLVAQAAQSLKMRKRIEQVIKRVSRDEMNMRLWVKYGR
jgi:predicted GIY-YIG superfamily endonuclease